LQEQGLVEAIRFMCIIK